MRVMVLVKASPASEAGVMPSEQLLRDMTEFNEKLVAAGVMKAGEGLHPSSRGFRVKFSGSERTVVDGPFAETKELVAGFWIWEVKSLQEAIDWVKQCPNPHADDSEIEIRQIFEFEDFGEALTPDLREREQQMIRQLSGAGVTPDRFEQGPARRIVGLGARYTHETSAAGIGPQWEKFVRHLGTIPGQVGKTCYGVCVMADGCGDFEYVCGVEVAAGAETPPGFTAVELTPQRYAVFTHRGHVSAIPQTIQAIWREWLPNSGLKLAPAPCFERYTEEFDPQSGTGGMEIWAPIIE